MAPTPRKRAVRKESGTQNETPITSKMSVSTETEEQMNVAMEAEEEANRVSDIRGLMECPVCLNYPRRSPMFCKERLVYTCKNAHIVCGFCYEKLRSANAMGLNTAMARNVNPSFTTAKCPTCREPELSPSWIAGKILEKAMIGKRIRCRNEVYGCEQQTSWEIMYYHEISCTFREVICFATHRDACTWVGTLPSLIRHVMETGCVTVVKNIKENELVFQANLGNFQDTRITVFLSDTTLHWRPVLLMSDKVGKYLIYVTFMRDVSGDWYITVRSVSPPYIRQKITYSIKIFYDGVESRQVKCSWTGFPVSHSNSNEEVMNSGEYLMFNDSQLRNLTSKPYIFEYEVELNFEDNETDVPGMPEITIPEATIPDKSL